jgi:hypothetical protein
LFLKLDDALRRRKESSWRFGNSCARGDIDRLLDYCQALESVLPLDGDQIPSFAARLLEENGLHTFSRTNMVGLLRDMYTLRNKAMHGEYDRVLEERVGTQHGLRDVEHFRRCVHNLAILYLLNPDQDGRPNLKRFIKQLRKGKAVQLKTL